MILKKIATITYLVFAVALISFWAYTQFSKSSEQEAKTTLESVQTTLDARIASYEAKLTTNPNDVPALLALGSAYLQKVRETADVSYYSKVDDVASKVIALDVNNPDAYALQGEVALGKHNFQDALRLGNKSVELNPSKALYYGIVADAQTELGQNDAAIATLQKMVDLRPDYNSYSRIAYARELYGEIDGSKEAIKIAVEAGSSFEENIAWGEVEYGKLSLRTNLDEAEQHFERALSIVPNYASALDGLGKVYFAKGDTDKAIEYFEKAFEQLPIAQYATDLGDAHKVLGDTNKAEQYYSLAQVAYSQSESSGVNTDMELALFLAERDLDLQKAMQLAEKSYLVRPSIYGADVLAWALYKNGDNVGAQKYIDEALRLGEHDPLIVFHAAKIVEKSGDTAKAEKYMQKIRALNPHFSILHSKF